MGRKAYCLTHNGMAYYFAFGAHFRAGVCAPHACIHRRCFITTFHVPPSGGYRSNKNGKQMHCVLIIKTLFDGSFYGFVIYILYICMRAQSRNTIRTTEPAHKKCYSSWLSYFLRLHLYIVGSLACRALAVSMRCDN